MLLKIALVGRGRVRDWNMSRYPFAGFSTLFFLVAISKPSFAMEIENSPSLQNRYSMEVKGEIRKGDYRRITTEIVSRGEFPDMMYIDSPGGDVEEAIKIGRFARSSLLIVNPGDRCTSACALVVFASVVHSGDGEIGIHRPFYDRAYFAGLSAEEARKEYGRLEQAVKSYMREMRVPTAVAEQMMTVPSDRVVILPMQKYRQLAGRNPPAYDEWLKARCEVLTEKEERDYKSINPLARERGEANAEKAENLSPGYQEYLFKKAYKAAQCGWGAIRAEQAKIMTKLKKELGTP
jgi:hypothetical protein